MRLRREASLGIAAILGLQLLLSALAISLLTRIGPAIERILEENIYSSEAVEEMLAILATPDSASQEVPEAFEAALQRAKENITEEAERPLLESIERQKRAAFAGERTEIISSLRQLSQVNRNSTRKADRQANRLGQAGAWAAAMLGALTLGLGIVVYRRLRLRLELPIEELRRTTQRIREGNLHARCFVTDAPIEVKQITADLNWLLDQWQQKTERPIPTQDTREEDIRRALCWLLDQQPSPTLLIDQSNAVVALNQQALSVDLPSALKEKGLSSDGWEILEIPSSGLRLLRQAASVEPR